MKRLLAALLISALLMSGSGFANVNFLQGSPAHAPAQVGFDNAAELTDGELSLVAGEGPIAAIGGAFLGGITGALTYGTAVEDRTAGGWFVAIVMGAAGLAVPGFLAPTP